MNKKFILLTAFLLLLNACSKKTTEYSAIPFPDKISVSPGGDSFIAIKIEIPDRHYIYGNPKGPGVGKATEVIIKPSREFTFSRARFLQPQKHIDPAEKNFTWTYPVSTMIFVPFKTGQKVPTGIYHASLTLDTLLCNDSSCMPRTFELRQTIEVTESAALSYGNDILDLYKRSMEPGDFEKKERPQPDDKKTTEKNISQGITTIKSGEIKFPPANFINETFNPVFLDSSSIAGILQAVLFGIIAGFILNFMPCVLPVVSLKIMSFVKHAGKEKNEVAGLGIVFSLGIITSFLFLASLAVLFGYNWGDLFQYRYFLIALTAVIFALALSMFDVFMINVPSFAGKAGKNIGNPYADAYLKGLLATLLATPCSGPFLGGTLAWTLNQSPVIVYTIFASIGVGMSLPYIILSINTNLVKFIPKPGEWTRTFEHIMGFLLILTVIYLMNIMDAKTAMPMMTFLVFIAMGFWQFGKFGSIDKPKNKRIISALMLLIILSGGYIISFVYLHSGSGPVFFKGSNFDVNLLYENRAKGKISMVKFTADWCPNCKFVEKVSLNTERVAREINSKGVEFMTADMTQNNPPARDLLMKLQSRSIPFLAIFPYGSSFTNPICLRDIYSEGDVLKALGMAVKKSGGKNLN